MHSPFPHSNSVWMLQEEFSAAEEDNEADELWLWQISKLNCLHWANINATYRWTQREHFNTYCSQVHSYNTFESTFVNVAAAFNNTITLVLQLEIKNGCETLSILWYSFYLVNVNYALRFQSWGKFKIPRTDFGQSPSLLCYLKLHNLKPFSHSGNEVMGVW